MHRPTLLVLALAVAPACGGQKALTSVEIEARAESLQRRSRWEEARRLLDRGIADARARGDRAGEALLLLRRGSTLTEETRHRGGDAAPARADLEAGRRLAESVGDPQLRAVAFDRLGMQRYTGWFSSQAPADLAAADDLFRHALALREPGGDSPGLADSHFHVGLVHQMRGERPDAERWFGSSLAIAERLHDDVRMSNAYRHLGYMAQLRGDAAAAEDGYRRSLELREKAGGGVVIAAASLTLAEFRYDQDGDAERAWPMLARALAVSQELGSAAYTAKSYATMARVRHEQGRDDEALEHLRAAVATMEKAGSDEDVPEAWELMALIHLWRDQSAAAVTAVDRAVAVRGSPRLAALAALARARAGRTPAEPPAGTTDAVANARWALAAGRTDAALDAAVQGDDPETLALAAAAAARAGRADAWLRARAAAAKLSRAQELRFGKLGR